MLLASNNNISIQILTMLGISTDELRKAVITFEVDCLVTVDAEYNAQVEEDPETGELIVPVELKQYRLCVEEIDQG